MVTQAIQKENRRTLMCFDRSDGKLLWQSGVSYTENEPTQEMNPYCSGTPATDGERVYVCFGSAGVYAYAFDGKEAWHRDLGRLNHMFGNAVSPILYGELCILNFGPDEKARLIALNKSNGRTIWEVEPPKLDEAERQQGVPGGTGGRGFGPGMFVAPQMLSQADKNGDQKLTKDEFATLADSWFDKLDADARVAVVKDLTGSKVPLSGSALSGLDALYSTVQMPPGIPVATVAIDGASNAAVLVVEMLAIADAGLAARLEEFRAGGAR